MILLIFFFTNVLTLSGPGAVACDITRAEMSGKQGEKIHRREELGAPTRVRGGSAVEERVSVSQTKRERERERGSSVGELSLLASVQVQVEFCPKAKSFLRFVWAFADVFTGQSSPAPPGFYIYLHNI